MDKTAAFIAALVSLVALALVGVQAGGDSEFDFGDWRSAGDDEHKLTVIGDDHTGFLKSGTYPNFTLTGWSKGSGWYFDGWYDENGNLLSREKTYTITINGDTTVRAASYGGEKLDSFYVDTVVITPDDIGGATEVRNHYSGDTYEISKSGTPIPAGRYDYTNTFLFFIPIGHDKLFDGHYERHFSWTYGGKQYSFTMSGTMAEADKAMDVYRGPSCADGRRYFLNYGNVQSVSDKLMGMCSGMSGDKNRADFVLAYVQNCISYERDKDYNESREYWKPAFQTLLEAKGDCEDSAILYSCLMKAAGFDSALVTYDHNVKNERDTGHAVAAVALRDGPSDGASFVKDGKTLYYVEPGGRGMHVGEPWDDYYSSTNRAEILLL